MGIKFISEVEFGKDIELDNLKMEYDAVFLGLGAEKPSVYDIGNFKNIYNSILYRQIPVIYLYFLYNYGKIIFIRTHCIKFQAHFKV